MSRRTWSLWLLVVALVGVAQPAIGAPTLDNVRVSFIAFQLNAPLFIAEKEGFFADQGIRITWVPFNTGDQEVLPLLQGQIDVNGINILPGFLNAVARGERMRVVASKSVAGGKGSVGSMLIRKELVGTVKTLADLKGRKVATTPLGSGAHYGLYKGLRSAGITTDDVTLVHMPLPAIVAALQNGAVDAGTLPPPLDGQALAAGVGVKLFDFADVMEGEPLNFINYGPTLLERNRPLGVRFMIAFLRGLRQAHEGPTPRNVAIVAEYTKTDPEIVRRSGWAGTYPDGFIDINKMRRFQDWLWDLGLISVRNPIPSLVDTFFLEQARAALGITGR